MSEGQNLRVLCNATGLPRPIIEWHKNTSLLTSSKNGVLEIQSANLSDSGVYSCTAENRVGSAKQSLEIRVYRKSLRHLVN